MDSLQPFGAQPEGDLAEDGALEAPPEIGVDERRMHVRAYNYWASLLRDRPYPSITDLDPANLDDFGPNSVLLDFSQGVADPKIAWLGGALREECGLEDIANISEVPARSLLSRLTDHYLQIIANQAPVGFEAEFENHNGRNTMYRGILMPFSSDDDAIDFIYGVINWKEIADDATERAIAEEMARARVSAPAPAPPVAVWADGPNSGGPAPDESAPAPIALGAEACLADYLVAARETAETARSANARGRAALYEALGRAWDFALEAEGNAEEYEELLEDSGIRPQARAPMTPIVKLVFGAQYDKTRLTEFAAALGHAARLELGHGELGPWLEKHPGGLKAVVAAERAARRPAARPDATEAAYETLRRAPIQGFVTLDRDDGGAEEFALFVARRMPDGRFAIVAPVPGDKALIDRAVRKAAA